MSNRFGVRWISSLMNGTPSLSFTAGTMKDVLSTCLTGSFGTKTLTALTYDAATGLCTATVSGGNTFLQYQVVEIAGANEAGFNGQQRVSWISSTQFKYPPASAPSTATATGTLTAKTPGLADWSMPYSSGNKAMFKSTNTGANSCLLRLDDTNAVTGWNNTGSYASVFGVEGATDIDTYSAAFVASGSGWLRKSESISDATGREWLLIGDELSFYLFTYPNSGGTAYRLGGAGYFWGQFKSFRPGDAWGTLLSGGNNTYSSNCPTDFGRCGSPATSQQNKRLPRPYSQNPSGSVAAGFAGSALCDYLGYNPGLSSNANPVDNGIYTHGQVLVTEGYAIRGEMPGLIQPVVTTPFVHGTVRDDVPGYEGRLLLPVSMGAYSSATTAGQALLDLGTLTGSGWR